MFLIAVRFFRDLNFFDLTYRIEADAQLVSMFLGLFEFCSSSGLPIFQKSSTQK